MPLSDRFLSQESSFIKDSQGKAWLYGYDEKGEVPLIEAINELDVEKVRRLIAENVNLDVSPLGENSVPLEQILNVWFDYRGVAVALKLFDMAEMLLEAGANPCLVEYEYYLNEMLNDEDIFTRREDRDFVYAYIALLLHYGAKYDDHSIGLDFDSSAKVNSVDIANIILERYNFLFKTDETDVNNIGFEKRAAWMRKNNAAAAIQHCFKQFQKKNANEEGASLCSKSSSEHEVVEEASLHESVDENPDSPRLIF